MEAPSDWYEIDEWRDPIAKTTTVDDVHLAQPIGFVWFSKPRYRVKAKSRPAA